MARTIEAEKFDGDRSNLHEISEILERIRNIESLIDTLKTDADDEIHNGRVDDDVSVNVLFLSIPLKSIRSSIRAAKAEIERRGPTNLLYVADVLENASAIASNIWERTKDIIGLIPRSISGGIHKVATSTANIASKSLVLLVRARLNAKRTKGINYTKESYSIYLNSVRKELINSIEDFKRWRAQSLERVLSSYLYRFIFYNVDLYDYNRDIVAMMNRDVESFHLLGVSDLQEYVINKAEIVLNNISRKILILEQDISGGTFGRRE